MRRLVSAAVVAFVASTTADSQSAIEITLKQESTREAQTREQLQRLLKTYDVSKWIFTRSIITRGCTGRFWNAHARSETSCPSTS